MKLEGRAALVTGAGRRLGRAMALALAEDGADIAVHYHGSAAEAEEVVAEARSLGRRAVAVCADVRDGAALAEAVASVESAFGRLDVLVNSASVFERVAWNDIDQEHWEREIDVNLSGPFRLCRLTAPLLRTDGGGLIVNLVDPSGIRPWRHFLAHSVSKAGLVALTRGLARELAPDVRVNAICPGPVLWPESYSEAERAAVLAKVPLGRAGSPDDVVRALRYLVAAEYTTGDILHVEGGRLLS